MGCQRNIQSISLFGVCVGAFFLSYLLMLPQIRAVGRSVFQGTRLRRVHVYLTCLHELGAHSVFVVWARPAMFVRCSSAVRLLGLCL